MPKEFQRLQSQDMSKIGAIQDLVRGVGKIINPAKSIQQAIPAQNSIITEQDLASL